MYILAFWAFFLSLFLTKCAGQCPQPGYFECPYPNSDICCPNGDTCPSSKGTYCLRPATPLDKEWWLWLLVSIVLAIIVGAIRRGCTPVPDDRQARADGEREGLIRVRARQNNSNAAPQDPRNTATAPAWSPPTIPGTPVYTAPRPPAPTVEDPLPVFSRPATAPPPRPVTAPPPPGAGPFSKLYQDRTG